MVHQSESSRSRRPGAGAWLLRFLIIVIFYFLSAGPAWKMQKAGVISSSTFGDIYRPVEGLCGACAPADSFFAWYMHLWERKSDDTTA
jgi:hypothetical protein